MEPLNDPQRRIMYRIICAANGYSDQPTFPRNLISIFAWRSTAKDPKLLQVGSKYPDQIAQTDLRLHWAHVIRYIISNCGSNEQMPTHLAFCLNQYRNFWADRNSVGPITIRFRFKRNAVWVVILALKSYSSANRF